ncbi:MAG: hypothetical protein A3J28_02665 [Acidobacteria bacterium RIFCSPLOWO2_12_FULL_60_22]|nr:MAG: hypothetical protein A3J28_02665 [Acidobacteria bacterium RIFCSPLOWO2_12_FULL_60_22]
MIGGLMEFSPQSSSRRVTGFLLAFSVLFAIAFQNRLFTLWNLWMQDPLYSVGAIVPIVSILLVWRKRHQLELLVQNPNPLGLVFLLIASLGANVLPSTGLLFAVYWTGVTLVMGGSRLARELWFPLGLLLFVIPIPTAIVSTYNYPLQILSANVTATMAKVAGISVIQEGPILRLPNAQLTVAPECNGLRTLAGLLLIGLLAGYFSQGPLISRLFLPVLTVPTAYLVNFIRLFLDVLLVNALSSSFWLQYERTYDLTIGLITFVIACMLFAKLIVLLKCRLSFEVSH